jgi:hypothetical protein
MATSTSIVSRSERGTSLVLERLEYGKYTDGRGTVESMEHTVLAVSQDFPAKLADWCGPRIVGPALRDNDRRPEWAPHGSVLLPVAIDGQPRLLFTRVQEKPEGRANRDYQRARYISAGEASPLQLFLAMDKRPLEEMTRSAPGTRLPNLTVPEVPSLRHLPPGFLSTAVVQILAGTPVAVERKTNHSGLTLPAEVNERQFFELAEAIWRALPGPIRPWFSAGWGVAESLRGYLAFSAGYAADENCAVFDLGTGKWTGLREEQDLPARQAAARQTETRLATAYVKAILPEGTIEAREIPHRRFVDALTATLRAPNAGGVMKWVDSRRAMQWVGRAHADGWRLDQVERGFASPPSSSLAPETLAKAFWFELASPRICVELAMRGLLGETTERTAAWFLARWDSDRTLVAEVVNKLAPKERPLAELTKRFLSVRRTDCRELLRGLLDVGGNPALQAAPDGPPRDGPVLHDAVRDEARAAVLLEGLKGLSPDLAALHDQVLRQDDLPSAYRVFLDNNAFALGLAIQYADPDQAKARVSRILVHEPSQLAGLLALEQLLNDNPPSPGDAKSLEADAPTEAADLRQTILFRWEKYVGGGAKDSQNCLLRWALEFVEKGPLPVVDVCRWYKSDRQVKLDKALIAAAIAEVNRGRYPPDATPALAAMAEDNLDACLPAILEYPLYWGDVARHWSDQLARLLNLRDSESNGLPKAAGKLSSISVERLVRYWCLDNFEFLDSKKMAPDLLRLTRLCAWGGQAPVTSACAEIFHSRQACEQFLQRGAVHLDSAVAIAHLNAALRGSRVQLNANYLAGLWSQPKMAPNMLLLLLLLFEHAPFVPTLDQLVLLSRKPSVRKVLTEHLRQFPERHVAFQWASADFQEQPYGPLSPGPDSQLWAACYAVPLQRQGHLLAALSHYGEEDQRQMLTLCRHYLRRMLEERVSQRLQVLNHVIDHFVVSLAEYMLGPARTWGRGPAGEFLDTIQVGGTPRLNQAPANPDDSRRDDVREYHSLGMVIVPSSPGNGKLLSRDFRDRVLVDPDFLQFIVTLKRMRYAEIQRLHGQGLVFGGF